MLTEEKAAEIEEAAEDIARRRRRAKKKLKAKKAAQAKVPAKPAAPVPTPKVPPTFDAAADLEWSKKNLRWTDGRPYLDIANVLRVLMIQKEYAGRFIYNETLGKVLDKGSVMLDWKISNCCADIQERFLPEVPEDTVRQALIICANRNGVRK